MSTQNPGLEPRTVPPPPPAPAGVAATRPTNSMAVVSLVAGILGYVPFPHPFIAGVVAILAGHVARKQIRETGEAGGNLALAGLILGYVHLALSVVVVILVVLFLLGGLAFLIGSAQH